MISVVVVEVAGVAEVAGSFTCVASWKYKEDLIFPTRILNLISAVFLKSMNAISSI